jgi:hypothetical protein
LRHVARKGKSKIRKAYEKERAFLKGRNKGKYAIKWGMEEKIECSDLDCIHLPLSMF